MATKEQATAMARGAARRYPAEDYCIYQSGNNQWFYGRLTHWMTGKAADGQFIKDRFPRMEQVTP